MILPTKLSPTSLLTQNNLPLEWIYLHHKGTRVLTPHLHKVAELVCQAFDPHDVILPLGEKDFERELILNEKIKIAFSGYYGCIGNHYPAEKLWDFLQKTEFIINSIIQPIPISNAPVCFVDGSSTAKRGIHGPDLHLTINSPYVSAQKVKLYTIITLLKKSFFDLLSFLILCMY